MLYQDALKKENYNYQAFLIHANVTGNVILILSPFKEGKAVFLSIYLSNQTKEL